MNKKLRNLIIIVVLLAVVAIAGKKAGWFGKGEVTEVETAMVERRTVTQTVSASGKIQPEKEVKISSEVSGEIVELTVRDGDKVKKGDLLVKINQDIYLSALNRARAAFNSSKSQLAQAEAQFIEANNNYGRNKTLYEKKVISDAEWDAANSAYKIAQLNVESARFQAESAGATLKEAEDNLRRTTIYSPIDGTVSALYVELGERVVGTAQMTGTELLRVADLGNMEVVVDVNENDIIRVTKGDTAKVEVDAYVGKSFIGVVTEIANSAKLTGVSADQVTNFSVKIKLLPESFEEMITEKNKVPLRPGMTATVEIRTETISDALAIPIQSVTTRSDTSAEASSYRNRKVSTSVEEYEVVFVLSGNEAKLRVVKTGIQDDKFIVVTEGVEEEEEIITGPYSEVSKKLKSGMEVKKKSASEKKNKEE
jgi:HlyD family secretion protein